MLIPVQITYRDMGESEALSTLIRVRAQRLERYYDRISACRVLVEQPHRHSRSGEHFHVRINLTVPGGELLVEREPTQRSRHEDAYVAVSDAFRAARRKLQDYVRRRRPYKKHHARTPHGRVGKIYSAEGFGFIETDDGREIYFDRRSVLHGAFPRLAIGAKVRFAEESGESGPQASTVELLRGPRVT